MEITQYLQEYLHEIDITNGVLLVFIPHTTAGVTINEHADPSVVRDILTYLKNSFLIEEITNIWKVILMLI